MKKELIQIRISKTDKDKLESKAKKEDMTMSESIRFLIRKWVNN